MAVRAGADLDHSHELPAQLPAAVELSGLGDFGDGCPGEPQVTWVRDGYLETIRQRAKWSASSGL